MKQRFYIGVNIRKQVREMFKSGIKPNERTHPEYSYAIGPFRTKRGAEYMLAYPMTRSVRDAENKAELLAEWRLGSP